jgi:pimeloyl-ACP methyl ester carboxylesterase
MKNLIKIIISTVLSLCMAFFANAQTSMDYNILIEDLEFQPGVTIDINVNVYVNENAASWSNRGKVFGVEGMAHTANCLKPFAEKLFEGSFQGMEINEFYAIDMPGRGGSGLPEGNDFLLEDMYLEDFLAVIEGALTYLHDELNVYPKTLLGHSMGGLEVIMLQDKLINEGTNLKMKYKFKNVILLSPAIPGPVYWSFISGGGSSGLFDYIDYFTPEYGTVLNIPYYVWPFVFFTNTCCYSPPNMVPGAPTPAEVLANGYSSIEPAPLLLQVGGSQIPPGLPYPFKPRPQVDEGIFKMCNGVHLNIVTDQYDKMMNPAEEEVLYEYLTGDKKHKHFFEVMGDETCHDAHIANPEAVVNALNTAPPYMSDYSILLEDVEVEPGVTIDINVNVYVNENAIHPNYNGGRVFAIHGMSHTANTWKPFSEALFETDVLGYNINQVYAIDLPGRGGSGIPEGNGFLMEDLYSEHYLNIIFNVLDKLADMKIKPRTIMGHSMGGLWVQLMQQRMLDQGTTLWNEYKIKRAILFAPAPAAPSPWYHITSGQGGSLAQFAGYFPGLGTMLAIPDQVFPFIFFTNETYQPPATVPGAPTPADVTAEGYGAMEPGPLVFEIAGYQPPAPYPFKPRPSVDEKIFKRHNKTKLTVISYTGDMLMDEFDEDSLYIFLTGDHKYRRYHELSGDFTCHDLHLSNPVAILDSLGWYGFLKDAEAGSDEIVTTEDQKFTIFPNPFNREVTLSFTLSTGGQVSVKIYNSNGVEVRTLSQNYEGAGDHKINLALDDLPVGVYICTLITESSVSVQKIVRIVK